MPRLPPCTPLRNNPLKRPSPHLPPVAYISVTCEATGLYAWAALHVAKRTVGRPQLLLACFFLLSSLVSALTCAEVALVTLTPIMVYSAGAANMEHMALMCVHLAAASLGGMLLPVASGINIVTSQAFHLSLLRFCGWMLAPTFGERAVPGGAWLAGKGRLDFGLVLQRLSTWRAPHGHEKLLLGMP